MSELKPCHCGGSATLWTAPFGNYIKCDKCGEVVTFLDFDDEKLELAWNRRAHPDSAPLTLEELRGMDGDKIQIHHIGHCEGFYEDEVAPYYGDMEQYIQRYNGMLRACDLPLKYYGIGWTATAYRRKPEPEGGDKE